MFQAEVEAGGRNFRWANGLGRIYLPGLEPGTPRMLIRMASGYPPERGEQVVTVRLDGTMMGQHAVGRGWVDYEFFIPPEWEPPGTGMPLLELEVNPVWRPGQLFGVEDRREVGIAVDLIRWGE